ncbi:flagellar hook-associated protein 2 [Limnohabitans sp. MORI2]|uniref:flagellar filament capping protein FliD n=1 Tax=Limnohabitans sp. MORI2 TaxID=1751150 RepID=UPI002376EDCB|nr:flagellar filament capping protein FliD [Limnohabitans sp. MORI2]BDU57523.1 flagellar hook-associated protein 2 [Limnohabitans sp. MORI2]
MATSAVSSTSTSASSTAAKTATSSAANIAAANRAAAQKLLTSLNAGSGVDVASLAQNLVDAESVPQKNAINAKITKNEARISGYAAVSFVASELNNAFTALKDQNSFSSLAATNTQPNAFSVTTTASAVAGSHDIEVLQLAKSQRTISAGFASASASVNGGNPMSLTLTVGGVAKPAINLAEGKDTPQNIVDAINLAKTGVTATLVNTGDTSGPAFQIVLTGPKGAAGAFSLSSSYTQVGGAVSSTPNAGSSGLSFPANTANQVATDAMVKVDGITIKRSSNTLTDVLAGVTIDLKAPTSATEGAANLSLVRDTTALKEKFKTLVTTYNDAASMLNVVSDPKSTVDTYGATLVGDSTTRSVKSLMRNLVQGESNTPGTKITAMWQMGLSIDRSGVMTLDEAKLDAALTDNFDDVVKTMTGNTNGLSAYSVQPAGFAGEAMRKLSKLIGPNGPLLSNSQNAETQNTKYQADLSKLETRMTTLLARYNKQFASMESIVGSVNSQKTSLKSSFDGMMSVYTNK